MSQTGEKPFKSSKCSFVAVKEYYLNGHIRSHTGDKPCNCPDCSYATARKSFLTKQSDDKHNLKILKRSNM
jgi:KRAB domain-containing zinc finger protein